MDHKPKRQPVRRRAPVELPSKLVQHVDEPKGYTASVGTDDTVSTKQAGRGLVILGGLMLVVAGEVWAWSQGGPLQAALILAAALMATGFAMAVFGGA